jgi:hypothetical protein
MQCPYKKTCIFCVTSVSKILLHRLLINFSWLSAPIFAIWNIALDLFVEVLKNNEESVEYNTLNVRRVSCF